MTITDYQSVQLYVGKVVYVGIGERLRPLASHPLPLSLSLNSLHLSTSIFPFSLTISVSLSPLPRLPLPLLSLPRSSHRKSLSLLRHSPRISSFFPGSLSLPHPPLSLAPCAFILLALSPPPLSLFSLSLFPSSLPAPSLYPRFQRSRKDKRIV